MINTIEGMRKSTFGELISQYSPDELHLFDSLRVFIDDIGNFWFIGSEVAEIMGYQNPWKAIRDHVPDQYKMNSRTIRSAIPTRGNPNFNEIVLINEQALYALAMRSKLPQAYQFQDWVYRVISRIRQSGGYISHDPRLKQVVDVIPEHLRPAFDRMYDTVKQQQNIISEQQQLIDNIQPKADYYDAAMDNSRGVPLTVIAKDFGMSANELHYLLFHFHVIYRSGDTWVLYKEHQDQGYTASKSKVTMVDSEGQVYGRYEIATYWTEKGKQFIYQKLIDNGYVPSCE